MELVIDVTITIRNQTQVIHKTEDAEISHAEDMKDVKHQGEIKDNADQMYAQLVKKTWNMTRQLAAEIDSKVNVSNATSMKRTDEFLWPEITLLTDSNAELVPMVKFSLEVYAKIAHRINTLKTMYASATTTIEFKQEDEI